MPCLFAFIACSYALSTLTEDWRWSLPWPRSGRSSSCPSIAPCFLASYRPVRFRFFRKAGQFALRFVIAFLMGLTISHPLTLLLFRDTIQAEVERNRQQEIAAVQAAAVPQQQAVQEKIAASEGEIAALQKQLDGTFNGDIPDNWELNTKAKDNKTEDDKAQAALNDQLAKAGAPTLERMAKIDEEMKPLHEQFSTVQTDLDFWQKEYEREINGQRSGFVGVGPRARSIEDDQLAWRRVEAGRLSGLIEHLTAEKTRLRKEASATETGMMQEFAERKTEDETRQKAERERLATLKKQIQEKQAEQFVTQLERTRATLSQEIDTKVEAVKGLHTELTLVGQHAEERIAKIKNSSRRDVLTQTLALHQLFRQGDGAGQFALYAYAVLTFLFMLVDTIPLLMKFFTKAGPYDTLLDRDEVRFEKDHQSFVQSYVRYVDELNQGRTLCLTQNKPLERALIEGVERSRVAKEFIESLVALEKAFEEHMRDEQASLTAGGAALSPTKKALLEHMAQSFYDDLRARMEQFFHEQKTARANAVSCCKRITPRGVLSLSPRVVPRLRERYPG